VPLATDLLPVIEEIRAERITSFGGIAKAFNERGIPTACPAQTRTHSIECCAVLCGTAEHVVRFCVDLCASFTKAKPTGPICRCGPQR